MNKKNVFGEVYGKWHELPAHAAAHWAIFVFAAVFATNSLLQVSAESQVASLESALSNSAAEVSRNVPARAPKLDPVPDEVLLKFKDNYGQEKRQQMMARHGLSEKKEIPRIGVKVMKIKQDDTPEEVVQRIKMSDADAVEFAEVNARTAPDYIVNDPYTYTTNGPWHLKNIGANYAADKTNGNGLIVAILDTGVNCSVDLNCVPGWNFWDNNSNTSDDRGHGTHVANVAGGVGDNGKLSTGVASNIKIMPLRISGADGYTSISTSANALTWAADHGAKVANESFGGIAVSSTMESAAKYLKSKGGLFTVSAGNEGQYMSAVNNTQIVVSATDYNVDAAATWTNYGPVVDIAAPGSHIVAPGVDGKIWIGTGTSASAPQVAAALALIFAANPGMTPEQAEALLYGSAKDINTPGYDQLTGWGRLDVGKALGASRADDSVAPSVPQITLTPAGSAVTVSWTPSTDNVGVSKYVLTRKLYLVNTPSPLGETVYSTTGAGPLSFTDNQLAEGTSYTYQLTAVDDAGNYAVRSQTYTVPSTSAPASPSNLVGTALSNTQISLTWTDNSNNEQYFNLEKSMDGVTYSTLLNTNATSYTSSGLATSTTYYFRVRSYNSAGYSPYSNVVTVKTLGSASPSPSPSPVSYTVTVSKSGTGTGTVTDSIGKVGCGSVCSATFTSGTSVTLTATPAANSTFAGWSGPCTGIASTCTFSTSGNTTVGASFTAQIAADTVAPSAPTNLVANVVSGAVNLSWGASTDNVGIAGYRIYRGGQQIATTQSLGYSDAQVASGTTYAYYVVAYDAAGNVSPQSVSATATVPTVAQTLSLTSFQVTKKTTNSATITWTTNLPSTGNIVYGTSAAALTNTVSDPASSLTHTLMLSGLSKSTKYYYQIIVTDGNTTTKTQVSTFRTMSK